MALAVSLPLTVGPDGAYFQWRAKIIVASCMVLVVTLLLAGLTMPLVMHLAGLDTEGDAERLAELELVRGAGERAHQALASLPDLPAAVVDRLDHMREQLESDLLDRTVQETIDEDLVSRHAHRRVMREANVVALAAAREYIVEARNTQGVDPVVVDRILQRLDMQSTLYRRG